MEIGILLGIFRQYWLVPGLLEYDKAEIEAMYQKFTSTVLYALRYTLSKRLCVGFDPPENGYEVLKIFVDGCNFLWGIFYRFPKSVQLDACFGELKGGGDHS